MTVRHTKTSIKFERMPAPIHMFEKPEDAPACYGSARGRKMDCLLGRCAFHDRCADFHLVAKGKWPGMSIDVDGRHTLRVWPSDAPLIPDPYGFRESVRPIHGQHPDTSKALNTLIRACYSSREADVAIHAGRGHWGGLIPDRTAAEIGFRAIHFLRWLRSHPRWEIRRRNPFFATDVWLTAEIARRALRMQGRPGAFRARFHFEVWKGVVASRILSCTLQDHWRRVNKLHRCFEREWCDEP